MLRLIKLFRPYIFLLIVVLVLVYVQVMTDLALPDYMAKIVNEGIVGQNNDFILKTGFTMLLVSLLGAVCSIGVGFLSSRVATGYSSDLRERVFSKVEQFSLTEFNTFSPASLITRSTNDIQQIQMVLLMFFRVVLAAPIMGIGAVLKAYQLAPSMSWIIGLAVAIMFGVIILLFSVAMPKFKLLQKLVDKLNLVTRENLNGIRVIRAFNNEQFEKSKFETVNTDLTDVSLFVNRVMVFMQPFMMLVFNFTMIGIIWIGAHLINSDNLMIGNMMAFMQYSMQVIMSFLMISVMFIMIPRASVSVDRIAQVLSSETSIKDPESPVTTEHKNGRVDFKDVSFSYPGGSEPVLEHISFAALPGEITAFVGSTGSGKSTLINLIPRFYDVTSGKICIDGVDIRDQKQEDLRRIIGYIPQNGLLFSGTVESNIRYGKPEASESDVKTAAETSQAAEFITALEQSYDSPISQGGSNVSGGQKQRLAIARALVRNPEVYIFDDSFSALDFATDARLRKTLQKEIADKTILIVAQRVSTIMHAQKIIVLDEGKIVGAGTHEELLKTCEVYKEIASSQLSEKELHVDFEAGKKVSSPHKTSVPTDSGEEVLP